MLDQFTEKLSFYVLNELNDEETAEIEKHIQECKSCRDKVYELRALYEYMSDMEEIEPPIDFKDNLASRAENELWGSTQKKKLSYIRYIRYSSVAAVFILCVVSVFLFNNFNTHMVKPVSQSTTVTTDTIGTTKGKAESNSAADQVKPSVSVSSKTQDANNPLESNQKQDSSGGIKSEPIAPAQKSQESDKGSVSVSDRSFSEANSGSTEVPVITDRSETQGNTKNTADNDKNSTSDNSTSSVKSTSSATSNLKHVLKLKQDVNIKTGNKAAAAEWISNQAAKVNAVVMPSIKASTLTTQDFTYAAAKSTTPLLDSKQNETVIVEVKSEDCDQFVKMLKDYFGTDNVSYEAASDITADTVRLEIKISEQ